MSNFEPVMTQDDLDEIIRNRIARERKRHGDGTDWVAEARKWEARAKQTNEQVSTLQEEADTWRRRAKYNRTALQQTEKLYERFLDRFGEFLDKEFDDE